MVAIGKFHELVITRLVEFGAYLDAHEGDEVLIPGKYLPDNAAVGDALRVFVYPDSKDRHVATTEQPFAQEGEYACLTVVDANHLGAFLHLGLTKHLLVPFREQARPMQANEQHVVRICADPRTNRLIGTSRFSAFFNKDTSSLQVGQAVNLLVYQITDIAYKVIIDHQFTGLLYRNEVFQPLHYGQAVKGFIKQVREDGKVDVALQAQGYQAVATAEEQLMAAITQASGFLPLTDKSDPDDIKQQLQMSKKTFKKAVGALYKKQLITLEANGLRKV